VGTQTHDRRKEIVNHCFFEQLLQWTVPSFHLSTGAPQQLESLAIAFLREVAEAFRFE